MIAQLIKAGLVVLALVAATPDGRRQVGKVLKGLEEGLSEYARHSEAEKRRAAALEAVMWS